MTTNVLAKKLGQSTIVTLHEFGDHYDSSIHTEMHAEKHAGPNNARGVPDNPTRRGAGRGTP